MKYIIFDDNTAIIFANSTSHKDIADKKSVRSAGFCTIETYRNSFDDIRARVSCYGESISLGVKSNESDNKIIERMWF